MSNPKYEVGKTYKDKRGDSIKIVSISLESSTLPIMGSPKNKPERFYTADGSYCPNVESEYDLLPPDQTKPAKKLTQHDYISLSLAKGESISNKNAYAFCGTMKLSTRIGEIEKAHNVAFKRTPEQHILKCNGRKGNHTVYSLDGALSEQSTEFQNYIKSLNAMIPTTIEEIIKKYGEQQAAIYSYESNTLKAVVDCDDFVSIEGKVTPNTSIHAPMTVNDVCGPKTGIIVTSITIKDPETGFTTIKD